MALSGGLQVKSQGRVVDHEVVGIGLGRKNSARTPRGSHISTKLIFLDSITDQLVRIV